MGLSFCVVAKAQFLSKLHLTISQNPGSFEAVNFLSLIFLTTLSFSLFSCPNGNGNGEDRRRFRGSREKIETPKKRDNRPEVRENSIKNLGFPIMINPTVHRDLSITSTDNKKMYISVEPSEKPMEVVAGMSGQLSLSTENGVHTFILSSSTSSKAIYLELTEENTRLKVINDVSSVNQTQVLAQTTSPLIFYVKENEELTVICFPIEVLEKTINVKKGFADHPDCP